VLGPTPFISTVTTLSPVTISTNPAESNLVAGDATLYDIIIEVLEADQDFPSTTPPLLIRSPILVPPVSSGSPVTPACLDQILPGPTNEESLPKDVPVLPKPPLQSPLRYDSLEAIYARYIAARNA